MTRRMSLGEQVNFDLAVARIEADLRVARIAASDRALQALYEPDFEKAQALLREAEEAAINPKVKRSQVGREWNPAELDRAIGALVNRG